MIVLALDTAVSFASAALVADRRVLSEARHPPLHSCARTAGRRTNHAEVILPLVEKVLREAALGLPEISGMAVSIGPGSFTGLRIALSTVKGLAFGWDIPIAAVSTLTANAARAPACGLICSCLDARKREVYMALFRRDGLGLERLLPDALTSITETVEIVKRVAADDPPIWFVGEGAAAYRELIEREFDGRVRITSGECYGTIAAAVGRLGEERLERGEVDSLAALVPAYLRRPEAEIKAT